MVSARPSITARQLFDELLNRGILKQHELVSVLGEDRNNPSLIALERAMSRTALVGDDALATLKAEISGLEPVRDVHLLTPSSRLAKDVARHTGSILIEGERPILLMVEDLPDHVDKVSEALGGGDFEVRLCTIGQFSDLYRACYQNQHLALLPDVADLAEVFDACIRRRGSDAHLSAGQPPVLRVDGELVPMDVKPLDVDFLRREIANLAGDERFEVWQRNHDADMALTFGTARFRINFGRDLKGPTIAARRLPSKIPTPQDLGLPRSVQDMAFLDRGLVLITGPTGSGKSTTMAALLNSLIHSHARHILTLEDPVEFLFPQGMSVVHQREFGQDFLSFPQGLRQALRQDPDVIFVGEMRDRDTISTAVTAAETGHLVFGTLHTYDVGSTVSRIVGVFPPEEQDHVRAQLAYVLKGVVSQTLLKLARGEGRIAAFEVLTATPAVSNTLRKTDGQSTLRQIVETSVRDGMQTMDMALSDLVRRGQITEEQALEKCRDPEDLMRRIKDA